MKLTKPRLIASLAIATALFNVAVGVKLPFALVESVLAFGYLLFVPGLLVLLILRIKPVSPWRYSYYAALLSLVILMVSGVLINWLLPLMGIEHPLYFTRLFPILTVIFSSLLLGAFWRASPFEVVIKPSLHNTRHYLLPLLFPVLAVLGATSLNNGGSNIFTIIMLVGILANFIYMIFKADRLPANAIAFSIFCSAVAMLFMTSLRGWYVTGHDIQTEYYVFQLAKSGWHWDISLFRNPYNACLSLTVLPTMLTGLLHIEDSYVFKALYQILFALCPVAVFMLLRQFSNTRLALLSVLYFVCFPTFFTDMPMLNRQEIAFLFLAGMILLALDETISNKLRVILFATFGLGVILSHYSTTYSMIMILGSAAVLRLIFERKWFKKLVTPIFRLVRRDVPPFIGARRSMPLIALPMVMGLALAAFTWNTQITQTSRGAFDTIRKAVSDISGNLSADNTKSSDTKSSLFGGSTESPQETLAKFIKQEEKTRAEDETQDLYPSSSYDKTDIKPAPETIVPLTRLGKILSALHVDTYDLNSNLRQYSAKIIQLLLIIGIAGLFFAKKTNIRPKAEIMATIITSAAFLVALVLIPTLSLDYGLLRAFLQVLMVLSLPTVLGSLLVFQIFGERAKMVLATALASLFFISSTGLLAEATGGYLAQLHLHNSGTYYDNYYMHPGEVSAISWISANKAAENSIQSSIASDTYAVARLRSYANLNVQREIYPGLIQKDGYVFLDYTNITKQTTSALFNNESINYTLPIDFFDDNKDLIYSTNAARIYR